MEEDHHQMNLKPGSGGKALSPEGGGRGGKSSPPTRGAGRAGSSLSAP